VSKKRRPMITPGKACLKAKEKDDFTLPAALYYDSIYFYKLARDYDLEKDKVEECDRYKRASICAAFSFFEAYVNQTAFAHAETHDSKLNEFESNVLKEIETILDNQGNIQEKSKFYNTEARFSFLACFLSGKELDRGGNIWANFRRAKEIRNTWTHPKPPFDTWSLSVSDVRFVIESVRDLMIELSSMMEIEAVPRLYGDLAVSLDE